MSIHAECERCGNSLNLMGYSRGSHVPIFFGCECEGKMSQVKLFEIRDKMTFIPAMAVWIEPASVAERYLLARSGFGQFTAYGYVHLTRLSDAESHFYAHDWSGGTRTMPYAHDYILQNWRTLSSGDVIDVEFLLGEKAAPSLSERVSAGMVDL